MGSVLKGNRYRLVDNRSFELPLPLKYVLLKEDAEIAEYEVLEDESVSCRIITKYKEDMLTPLRRPLGISDIHYFFSCRVFQDKTPFTSSELSLLGLEKYNVYDIIRKTRGVTPYDTYWLRFDGDNCDYETAKATWDELMSNIGKEDKPKASEKTESAEKAPVSDADVKEILHQHKINFAEKLADIGVDEESAPEAVSESAPAPEEPKSSGGAMSQEDIEAMLSAASAVSEPELVFEAVPEEVAAEESKPSNAKMPDDDIQKLLAGIGADEETAPEPVTESEPEPVEESKPSNAKMSDDDIQKLLAGIGADEEPAPETVTESEPASVEESKPSNAKMSDDDIQKLLAGIGADEEPAPEPVTESEPEPAPVEESKPSNAKMSDEDIQKLLAGIGADEEPAPEPVTEPEPEPTPVEESKPSGGKMSDEDIQKLLAGIGADKEPAPETVTESEPEPAPVEESKPSGGKLSEDEIAALLNGMKEDAST